MGGGWVGVENEINANSAFNYDVIEVEAELGNILLNIIKSKDIPC